MMRRILILTLALLMVFTAGCGGRPGHEDTAPAPAAEPTASPEPTPEPMTVDFEGKKVIIDESLPLSDFTDEDFVREENGRIKCLRDDVTAVYGIDVSAWQEDVDWQKVAADGMEFAMLRLGRRNSEAGDHAFDAYFEKNYAGARAAGLKVGCYFYSSAITVQEAFEDAEAVLKVLNGRPLDLPVAFDWEVGNRDTSRNANVDGRVITRMADKFCERIQQAGYESVIYLNLYLSYFKYEISISQKYGLWFAGYREWPDLAYRFFMWQYSNEGRVSGINGNVDMDIMFHFAS